VSEQVSGSGEPEECFAALLQTLIIKLEAIASGHSHDRLQGALAELRGRLRGQLLALVQGRNGSAGACGSNHKQGQRAGKAIQGQLAHWVQLLLDRTDVVLRTADVLSPDRAAEQLTAMADELRWFASALADVLAHAQRRRLQRRSKQLAIESQERLLQYRLERLLGRHAAAWFERLILLLIFLVLVIFGVEALPSLSPLQVWWLHVADACICVVFLTEFFLKLWLVPNRWLWFRRHWVVDLLSAIPFGLLAGWYEADAVRAGRLARLLRLPRLARYVRLLRPVVRLLRALGFLIRGLDRVARMYGPLLNWDVVLYPTPAERRAALSRRPSLAERIKRLLAICDRRWQALVAHAGPEQRAELVGRRLAVLESAEPSLRLDRLPLFAEATSEPRQVLLEQLWRRLEATTAHDIALSMHPDLVARLARVTRLFASPPVCWLPVLRKYVPRLAAGMSDAEVLAAAARRLATALRRYHHRLLWLADLYGTITPAQFVDRVGYLLVRNAERPAYRLAFFGGLFLLTKMVLPLLGLASLRPLEAFLDDYVGPTLVLLGSICLLLLGLGWWLQRLAREATEFYEKSAEAYFLALMEVIRARWIDRDAAILFRRVILPERALAGRVDMDELAEFAERARLALVGTHGKGKVLGGVDPVERTLLLYRDWLDGALLCLSDNRTTNQLLGNVSLQQLVNASWRMGRSERRHLRRLDLERQQSLMGGPYLWFNLIARAVAHEAAKLVVDYNLHAIPLAELELASPAERSRYERWLAGEQDGERGPEAAWRNLDYCTNAFTALHFLDYDPERDADVAARFGQPVLARLKRERRKLFRQVFGTYPHHLKPHERRVLNLRAAYERWLAGGKVLLLPLRLLWRSLRQVGRLLLWVVRAVREIREPTLLAEQMEAASADFATAVRKIERMRGPVVWACTRLRCLADAEYLGVQLPGLDSSLDEQHPQMELDFELLHPDPAKVEQMEGERHRAEADMSRLAALYETGLLERAARSVGLAPERFNTPEHKRAAAFCYLADVRGVRTYLSAREIVDEVCRLAAARPAESPRAWPRPILYYKFRRYWHQHGFGAGAERRAAWRAVARNFWGAARALRVWHKLGEGARQKGEKILADLLRHPHRFTEQLVILRAVHTLAMLDLVNYRQHVYQAGEYAADGEPPDSSETWARKAAGERSTVESARSA